MAETKLEDLRKWFGKGKKGDWVRVGTDGEIKGPCAREPDEGKPKCMPRSKAHSMTKKDRASSARRKRRQDPMADRPGTGNKPIMVKTDKKESVEMNEASATNVNKIRSAYRDFMKKKGKNFDDIAMSLTMIANRMTQLGRADSSGRGDYKAEKIIKDEASRIQGIVNKTYNTEEGKEIRALLIKHKIYGNGSPGSAIQRLTRESVNEASKVPAGMKFIASYVYKDANGKDHTHRHLRKGTKMTDPVVVYIDDKEWKTFQSFTKAKQAAINHIKGMKESVDMNESTMADRQVVKAVRIAKDMGGNMTGAVRRIEKMKKGLSDHPKVKAALRLANETYKPDGALESVEEKNVPTNPALWAKFKAQAKAKFDVYPSAYANGWAAKKYKAAGGSWKTVKENTEMKTFWELREAVGDTALAFQTPYGTVTATKRNTKGMRGKQDAYSLSLKTKSGKTVDLGSHPNPTKANVMSIAKNVMS